MVFGRRSEEVFDDISPIADYSGHLSLEFVDFTLCEDDVKYSISEQGAGCHICSTVKSKSKTL